MYTYSFLDYRSAIAQIWKRRKGETHLHLIVTQYPQGWSLCVMDEDVLYITKRAGHTPDELEAVMMQLGILKNNTEEEK